MNPTTIEDVLEQLGVKIASVRQTEFACHCPFHGDDRHPSFSVNTETGSFICFSCGERGSLKSLFKKLGGKGSISDVRFKAERKVRDVKQQENPYDPLMAFARYLTFHKPPAWAVDERLLNDEVIDTYGIKWQKGWVLPIWSPPPERAVFWGWQWKQLKYVRNYPQSITKSKTLFGIHQLPDRHLAILVESPLDVVRLAAVGYPWGVSSFGAMVSQAQIKLIFETVDKVILALDNDREGRAQTERIRRQFSKEIKTEVLEYPDDMVKDIGDMTDDQILEVFS